MNEQNRQIWQFIVDHPDIALRLLREHSIAIKGPVTLDAITKAVYPEIYEGNRPFILAFRKAMANDGYHNFEPISLGVSAGLSIISSVLGAGQAKKQRELMKAIALAQLSNEKYIRETEIRTQAETERERILLTSLAQYQTDLQKESTTRLRDAGIYVGILAAGISIIWGTVILLGPGKTNPA